MEIRVRKDLREAGRVRKGISLEGGFTSSCKEN
jgi:hypothetical protein